MLALVLKNLICIVRTADISCYVGEKNVNLFFVVFWSDGQTQVEDGITTNPRVS